VHPGLAFGEVYLAAEDPRVQFVEVFQHPDAGAAVDMGDGEVDHVVAAVLEVEEAPGYLGVIEKIVFAFFQPRRLPGTSLELVVIVQLVVAEDLVHGLAAVATEIFPVIGEGIGPAGFAAMKAGLFLHR